MKRAPGGFRPDAACPSVADAARPARFAPPDDADRVFLLERRPRGLRRAAVTAGRIRPVASG
ncbi:hypothetical protein ASF22_21290 [Methylobacterium sp. Leaf87]|nr:hypothetical protein ASF22_21290 [Methylobacterium sp. Leaf87]